jgi:glycosyltransferase involved in cell wall biosynthesis
MPELKNSVMCSDTTQKTVDVSVIIPAYNAGGHIERALNSVLTQTCRPKEIIVVDDCSTDNTAAIVKQYGPEVCYVYQDKGGCGAARNTGIKKSTCLWIAFLDADDQWQPQVLQLQMELLEKNKELMWSGANFIHCFCNEDKQTLAHDIDIAAGLLQNGSYFNYFDAFMAGCIGCVDTIIVKRSVFDELGMFKIGYPHGEDMDMWFRIAFRWPMTGYVAQPMAIYHRNVPNSMLTERKNLDVLREQFDRFFNYAKQYGREAEFAPCAVKFVKYYIDVMLQRGDRSDVLKFIGYFAHLLSFRYKTEMRLRAMFPRVAPVLLEQYIKLKRCLRHGRSSRQPG